MAAKLHGKLDLKEETKAQLTEKMKGQWKPPILECQRRHHEKDNKFTKILERLELVSKVPAKEYKRSLGFIVVLEVLSACIAWMTISSMLIYRRFFKQFDGMFN